MTVQVNSPAPTFELSGVVGKQFEEVNLSDYAGKWVVFPVGWHPGKPFLPPIPKNARR